MSTQGTPKHRFSLNDWGIGTTRKKQHCTSQSGACSVFAVGHSVNAATRIEQLLGDSAIVEAPRRGWYGALASVRGVLRSRAHTLYLADIGISTTLAAVLGRVMGKRVIVDTGDAGFALARSVGDRSFLGLLLVGVGERLALHSAHHIVVRGQAHASMVPRATTHIPDLPPPNARCQPRRESRRALALGDTFVVGLVGSLHFAPRRQTCYGWDLLEALALTDSTVTALIIGDGNGLGWLQARAHALGVNSRCRFLGRVPPDRVSSCVSAMDAAISTQTNDVVGRVRTTGKLPLYLACGCPVIASHVGEAARLLGPLGWTLAYDGVLDRLYPGRLAAAIERWRTDPAGADNRRRIAVRVAADAFDVEAMRGRVLTALTRVRA